MLLKIIGYCSFLSFLLTVGVPHCNHAKAATEEFDMNEADQGDDEDNESDYE